VTKREEAALCALVIAVVGCGGGGSGVPKCVPGDSKACSGLASCAGSQVCAADGTYATCVCGAGSAGAVGSAGSDGGGGGGAAGTVDASDAGPADALPAGSDAGDARADSSTDVAARWTPRSLGAPLVLWLDDTVGLGANWVDQSGRMPPNNEQWPASGAFVDKGVVNGLDALSIGFVPNGPGTFASAQDGFHSYVSVALVAKIMPGGGDVLWVQQSEPSTGSACVISLVSLAAADNPGGLALKCYGPPSAQPTVSIATTGKNYTDGIFHVVVLRFSSSMSTSQIDTVELQIDKESPIAASILGSSFAPGNGTLGASPGSAHTDFAEVVGVDGALSTDDESSLLDYFKQKFALIAY
jgi:hypothetical protein